MDCVLYTKCKLFTGASIIEGVSIDIDKCEEKIFYLKIGGENGNNFDHNHGKCKKYKQILIFEKSENYSFTSRSIYLVRVD